MSQKTLNKLSYAAFLFALALVVYMPLHVFIAQSASLITGGLDAWKAGKDILLFLVAPFIIFLAYKQKLFSDKLFQRLVILTAVYAGLHFLYVLFDTTDDTYSAIVATVYNVRLLGFLFLGYVVGAARQSKRFIKILLTATVLIAGLVAAFGVAQYFLPPDLLTNVGYSEERGVKYLFFIDDRPELPRVMSTLRDPNSLGAWLILPTLLVGYALFRPDEQNKLFIRNYRREVLAVLLGVMLFAQFLTFSRGALIGLILSLVTLLYIAMGQRVMIFIKKYWLLLLVLLLTVISSLYMLRNNTIIQDLVFHAAVSTDEADPNQKRIMLQQEALQDIVSQPQGFGPGRAGLVAIRNPQGGVLTENYYLQIAYEVGWLGIVAFFAILTMVVLRLSQLSGSSSLAAILLATFVGHAFYALLIHLWSNEAVALQWWLLTGTVFGASIHKDSQVKS